MDRNSTSVSTEPSNSNSVSLVLTACVISVLLIYLVYSENFVFGSVPGHWTYPYFETAPTFPQWIPLTVFVSLGLSIFIGSKLILSYEKITLFFCFLNAIFIQTLIRKVYPFSLEIIVKSDVANSFYTPAMNYSAFDILTKFNVLAPSFPLHAKSNMPGKILIFEFLKVFTTSPRIMGFLVVVLSSLGALLLYVICKQLFHDKRTAFYALTLYALIPCKIFFFPILNTVTPVFILLCFYLLLVCIEKKHILIPWLLGAALYIMILFEPSPLITGIIFLGIMLQAMSVKRFSTKDLRRLLINLGLGFLVVYIIFFVFLSFNLLQAFMYILKSAMSFNVETQRGYWIWIGENIKEFFYGAGIPIMILMIYMTAQIFSQWKTLTHIARWSLENVYVISLLITFTVVVFLGINRGEIMRLWVYLAVFFQVPASIYMAKIPKGEVLFFLVTGTLVFQTMLTLHRVGFIIP